MARRQVALQHSSVPPATPEIEGTFQASMADELASTVEHLLSTRYAAERLVEECQPKRVLPTVTVESLLAELAAAKAARCDQPPSLAPDPETARRSGSSVGKLFVLGCIAVVLLVMACRSPIRDYIPGPLRDQVDHVLARFDVH